MWKNYYSVTSIAEALKILSENGAGARIVAGGTDLILELERGVRKGIDTLIDITRVPCLDEIVMDEDEVIHLGPMVTHNQCVASKLIVERVFPLAQATWEVGAPQIRNRGTVAGNLITGSPANDTITPLMALGASVRLATVRGERVVPLAEFFTGVRRTVMAPDEMLVDISIPAMKSNQRGMFIKLGLRRAQAISVVNTAVILTLENGSKGSDQPGGVLGAAITLGSVAPKIIHAEAAEALLSGGKLDGATITQAAELAMQAARPIDDIRGSAAYRREMVRVCVSRSLHALANGEERARLSGATGVFVGGEKERWAGQTAGAKNPYPGFADRHADQWENLYVYNGSKQDSPAPVARGGGSDRDERGLCRGRMRRLHNISGWHGCDELPGAGGARSWG